VRLAGRVKLGVRVGRSDLGGVNASKTGFVSYPCRHVI
jgi:hypothetical protein